MSKHHNNNNGQNNPNVNEKPLDEEIIQNENTEELGDSVGNDENTEVNTEVNESETAEDKGESESSDEDKDKDEKPETPENKDSNVDETPVKTKTVNPVRWISKDIVAVDIVHGKSEVLPEKLRVELIDSSLTEATILSNGKYYRVPKSILL